MTTRTLQRDEWQSYFDLVSRFLHGKGAEIERLSEGLGAQREVVTWQMHGLAYNPGDDVFELVAEHLGHLIKNPVLIRVEEDGVLLKLIEITQGNGMRQIITIVEPLALPYDEWSYAH